MTKFVLKIELGNEAMQDGTDVAGALRKIAEKLETGREGGTILDENGNPVGQYETLYRALNRA